jgi:hypothetical protein
MMKKLIISLFTTLLFAQEWEMKNSTVAWLETLDWTTGNSNTNYGITADLSKTWDSSSFFISLAALNNFGLNYDFAKNTTLTEGAGITQLYLKHYITQDLLIKFGRQEIDTPMFYTEKWGVLNNSTDTIYLNYSPLDLLTFTFAHIGSSNGAVINNSDFFTQYDSYIGVTTQTAGVDLNYETLQSQLYFYYIKKTGGAAWFEIENKFIDTLTLGSQVIYTLQSPGTYAPLLAYAFKAQYHLQNTPFTFMGAYSLVGGDTNTTLPPYNQATYGQKTKLYTATIEGDGNIAAATDTQAFKLALKSDIFTAHTVELAYGTYMHGANTQAHSGSDSTTSELDMVYSYQSVDKKNQFYFGVILANETYQANKSDTLYRIWHKFYF